MTTPETPPQSVGTPARPSARWAIDELCERQLSDHHAALRATADGLQQRLSQLAAAHAGDEPSLRELTATFDVIHATLVSHLAKEENILFPAFRSLAAAWREGVSAPRLPFPTLRYPISLMEAEHERLERALDAARAIAAALQVPTEATSEWDACRRAFDQFEREFQSDTTFEDEILFPRALELERALL